MSGVPGSKAATDNLDSQVRWNSEQMQALVERDFNTEQTRGLALRFASADEISARAIGQAMFAKGMRLLTADPVKEADGRWIVALAVKHSLREITDLELTADLVGVAAAMGGTYVGWELMSEETAEQSQRHDEAAGETP